MLETKRTTVGIDTVDMQCVVLVWTKRCGILCMHSPSTSYSIYSIVQYRNYNLPQ
jgi:hypothetical protein